MWSKFQKNAVSDSTKGNSIFNGETQQTKLIEKNNENLYWKPCDFIFKSIYSTQWLFLLNGCSGCEEREKETAQGERFHNDLLHQDHDHHSNVKTKVPEARKAIPFSSRSFFLKHPAIDRMDISDTEKTHFQCQNLFKNIQTTLL